QPSPFSFCGSAREPTISTLFPYTTLFRSRIKLLPEKEFADEIEDESLDGLKPIEDFDVHHKNWLDSIRANKQPNCNVDLAVRDSDRKSTRLNSSHQIISYAVFCLKKKKNE